MRDDSYQCPKRLVQWHMNDSQNSYDCLDECLPLVFEWADIGQFWNVSCNPIGRELCRHKSSFVRVPNRPMMRNATPLPVLNLFRKRYNSRTRSINSLRSFFKVMCCHYNHNKKHFLGLFHCADLAILRFPGDASDSAYCSEQEVPELCPISCASSIDHPIG